MSSGAPVIPVGIGLDRQHIRRIEREVGGKPEVVTWYLGGLYALTVGRPLRFDGDVNDWAHVRLVSEQIMQRIIGLARESERRIERVQAAETDTRPTPALPASPAGASAAR